VRCACVYGALDFNGESQRPPSAHHTASCECAWPRRPPPVCPAHVHDVLDGAALLQLLVPLGRSGCCCTPAPSLAVLVIAHRACCAAAAADLLLLPTCCWRQLPQRLPRATTTTPPNAPARASMLPVSRQTRPRSKRPAPAGGKRPIITSWQTKVCPSASASPPRHLPAPPY